MLKSVDVISFKGCKFCITNDWCKLKNARWSSGVDY